MFAFNHHALRFLEQVYNQLSSWMNAFSKVQSCKNISYNDVVNFADDNFCVEWNKDLSVLIINWEKRLKMITKWLRDSGLVVNESKTEVCLFHTNDQPLIEITLLGMRIKSMKSINVLGVVLLVNSPGKCILLKPSQRQEKHFLRWDYSKFFHKLWNGSAAWCAFLLCFVL